VNGRYIRHFQAVVHIEERGMQFADGVYEVIFFLNQKLIDLTEHIDRLEYSLKELRLEMPVSRTALIHIIKEVVKQNKIQTGGVYLQISRGVAPRAHPFPHGVKPTLIVTVKRVPSSLLQVIESSSVISVPDIRWQRPDIKSISLLPNVLAKQKAYEQGKYEAVQVKEDGLVTEGSSTNFWIINHQDEILTPPSGQSILSGITRRTLLKLCEQNGLKALEKSFSLKDALQAKEAFLTGTTTFVRPVVQIDDTVIGQGKPGPLTLKLFELYKEYCLKEAS
jgi:D-alanine transaminase